MSVVIRRGGDMNSATQSKINWAVAISTIFVAIMNMVVLLEYVPAALAVEIISLGTVLINIAVWVFRTWWTGHKANA